MEEQTMMEEVSTELMKVAQKFVDLKNNLAELKMEIDEVKQEVLAAMKSEERNNLTITVEVENYYFEVEPSKERLLCIKQTRSPAPSVQIEP